MERFISDSPEETVEIGKKIASYLKAGDCVLYTGEMGAGKTHLTKGIAEYFGSTDDVTSPTFALVNEYEGDVPIFHFDLFRINTLDDLYRVLGNRQIALCRELTKIHEVVIKGTISEMIERYKELTPRGEYVLVVEGKPKVKENEDITLADAALMAKELVDGGIKPSDACRQVAGKTPFSKSEIYKEYLNM